MATIERRRRGGPNAPVRWRDPDGTQRSRTFLREDEARRFRVRLDGNVLAGAWIDPDRTRMTVAVSLSQLTSTRTLGGHRRYDATEVRRLLEPADETGATQP